MKIDPEKLRQDALTIWRAGLEAVRSDRLVREHVRVADGILRVAGDSIELDAVGRILVVGAGKAGAGMAAGFLEALGPRIVQEKRLGGWIHVPDDCVRPLPPIVLHPARPAGINEPTEAGVAGSAEMLRLVGELNANDLCIALISGGASALLPSPIEGVSLEAKLAVTRFLSAAGAPIEDLNRVRKHLSRIKGGNLARACRAGRMITLVISDVLGDPLGLIGSGPTVDDHGSAGEALAVLDRYQARQRGVPEEIFTALARETGRKRPPISCQVTNVVIGNNRVAVDAAGREATRLGYAPRLSSAAASEGAAEEVGRCLADEALAMRDGGTFDCIVSGGEPTVKLVDAARRGLGGRNQQLVLAASERLAASQADGVLILSAGTDGEDGPTDAAGAWVDLPVILAANARGLGAGQYLERNDAYHWFEPLGALVKTGPTHTNVCDVRVVLVARKQA